MNKDEFTSYLKDPGILNSESVNHLSSLISEFPYCQSARILLTLNLFKEQNIRYDAELKTTAVYVNNRRLLKKHIDKLNTKNVEVILPDEDISEKQEYTTVQVSEMEVVKEVAPEPQDSQMNSDDEAANILEVRDIVERHIQELESENELKRKNEEEAVKKPEPVRKKSDLIDEFIENQPSISRPKTQFYDPVDKAKESIVDNENIVSETLAGILLDQGYLLKAIKIYQKLSLKFPEKSSYFAALIKKAEKELKS